MKSKKLIKKIKGYRQINPKLAEPNVELGNNAEVLENIDYDNAADLYDEYKIDRHMEGY